MKGIIIVNGFYQNQSMKSQADELCYELNCLNIDTQIIKADKILAYINNGKILTNLPKCDFIVYLNKDKHLSLMLEKSGYRLFNSHSAIEICDDKMLTSIELASQNINIITTISSPIMYYPTEDNFATEIENKLNYPIVVKSNFGSMGKGVYLANNQTELKNLRDSMKLTPHCYQKFIPSNSTDIRVIVIGGKAVACMKRVGREKDFRSNIDLGGKGYPHNLTAEELDLSEKVAQILKLDYAGIDILQDESGKLYVCEVNSNAFFSGITAVSKVNIARLYANHICQAIKK